MDKDISIKEATGVIKEWGVDCDNFVAHNYSQSLHNGNPSDNSQELAQYFLACLKIVCDLGIKLLNTELIKEWRAESEKNWILLNTGPNDVNRIYAKCADQLEKLVSEKSKEVNHENRPEKEGRC